MCVTSKGGGTSVLSESMFSLNERQLQVFERSGALRSSP